MTRTCGVALVVVACSSALLRGADVTDRVERTVRLAPGRQILVENTVGDVTIVGSNRMDVAIEITRRAPTADGLARFPVVVDDSGNALRIAAPQREDGRDAALNSTMVIRTPAAAAFQAIRMFEGRLRVSGLTTACDADVQRGSIDASALAGRIRLESGLGGIDVRDTTLTPGGMLRLRVFNGPLRVRFARPPSNARILAVTLNGRITSDIPLTMKDQFGPRFGETTLGSGDPVMSLDVVKGDIAITVAR